MEAFDILNLFLILVMAWLGGAAANRVGYPSIVGELIVGIIMGPTLLGLLHSDQMVYVLSEVGIILLMVYIGMEIDFRDLKKASWPGLMAAIGGFITPFALGYFTVIWFGGTPTAGLFVAIAVGVTSLATKSRILVDLKLLNTRIAYVLMAGALISDTLALVIFAGILNFAEVGSVNVLELSIVSGKVVLFFVFTALIGLYALPWLGRYLSRARIGSSTLYFTLMIIIAFGFAELAELAGLHSILGAFMAGLFIREGVFSREVSKEINKVFHDASIGFLAPIFFVSAGFNVSLDVFQTDLPFMLTVITVAIVGKIAGTTLFYLPTGLGWREGFTVGAGMNGRGAVEIIIAGIGLQMGIISTDIFSILVFMAILTTLTVPFLLTWTTNWLRKRGELVPMDKRKGYLILGGNPLSVYMAKHLQAHEPVTIVDTNKSWEERLKEMGIHFVNGNALKEDTLVEAKAGSINTFIAMTSNSEVNLLAAHLANEPFAIPNKHILMSPGNEGADVDLLKGTGSSTIFAKKAHLAYWEHQITAGEFEERTDTVTEKTKPRRWMREHQHNGEEMLPMFILDEKGVKRPFHYSDRIEAGEQVFYLIAN